MHLHSVTLALPSPETEFDGHAAHALPFAIEYVLTEQFTHTLDELAPTTDENLPLIHRVQLALPSTVLKEPVLQGRQGPPSGPEKPISQGQSMVSDPVSHPAGLAQVGCV